MKNLIPHHVFLPSLTVSYFQTVALLLSDYSILLLKANATEDFVDQYILRCVLFIGLHTHLVMLGVHHHAKTTLLFSSVMALLEVWTRHTSRIYCTFYPSDRSTCNTICIGLENGYMRLKLYRVNQNFCYKQIW